MDDFTNDITTTGRLGLDALSFGNIEESFDADWFAVDMVAGVDYTFQLFGRGNPGLSLPTVKLRLFDGDSNEILRSTGAVTNSPLFHSLNGSVETTGTYYLEVEGFARFDETTTGSYALEYLQMVPETGNTRADALELPFGEPIGLVDNSTNVPLAGFRTIDTDWFYMDLDANQSYVVEMDGARVAFDEVVSAIGRVYGPDGTQIGSSADVSDVDVREIIRFETDAAGRYDLEIQSVDGEKEHYGLALKEITQIIGTDGNDWLTVPSNIDAVPDAISGGAGIDMISFASREGFPIFAQTTFGVLVNLETGLVQAEMPGFIALIMDSIEQVTGTSYDDLLYGASDADRIRGLGGQDMVYGSAGADRLDGGGGRDTLSYLFSDEGVQASLLRGRGWSGDAAGDQISGFETLIGTYHDDFLWGDHRANRLEGSTGNDTLIGNGGDDYILAGFGTDVVVYLGNRAEYEIIQNGIRTDVISDGWEGHDVIGHAEVLRFADGDVLL